MPLYREGPPIGGPSPFEPLDDPVRRPGCGAQSFGYSIGGLVMERVDAKAGRPKRACQSGAGFDLYLVDARPPGAGGIMVEGAGSLTRDVLHQGAAERDVEDLETATDRKRWACACAGGFDQRHLRGVTFGIRLFDGRIARGVVALGVDVFTAGEHETVARVDDRSCMADAGERRDDEGQRAGTLDGFDIRGIEADAAPMIIRADGGRDRDARWSGGSRIVA